MNKISQNLGKLTLNSTDEVNNILQNFIQHTSGNPIFFQDNRGIDHLLIHGTAPDSNGNVYFYIGEGNTFQNSPESYVSQKDLGKWMESQGHSSNTNVIACYAGYAQGDINSEFSNYNPIQIGATQDGHDLFITQASKKFVKTCMIKSQEFEKNNQFRKSDYLDKLAHSYIYFIKYAQPFNIFRKEPKRWVAKIRFQDKEHAKNSGFRWDPEQKEWFTNDENVINKLDNRIWNINPGNKSPQQQFEFEDSIVQSAFTKEQKQAIIDCIFFMEDRNTDFTKHKNSVGWNKIHSEFGRSLARNIDKYGTLTERQFEAAKKILSIYKNTQLPRNLVSIIFGD